MKDLNEMTVDELAGEIQHLDSYFLRCREIGQGINTKETVKFRKACTRYVELGGEDFRLEYDERYVKEFVEDWANLMKSNQRLGRMKC